METEQADMAKSAMMTVRLTPEVSEAWQIDEIKRGLDEARSGTPGVPHEEVEKWVRSWGTDHELPRPTARKA